MLARRLLTAGLGIPVYLGLLYLGGAWWAAFVALLTVLGSFEMVRLIRRAAALSDTPPLALSAAGGVLYVVAAYLSGGEPPYAWGPLTAVLVLAAFTREVFRSPRDPVHGVGGAVLAALYPGALMAHLVLLRGTEAGFLWCLMVTLGIWASDSAAYFIGSAFGRHKLIPQVSPNKTWEGAAGAVVGAALVGWLFAVWTDLSSAAGIAAGAAISVAGQLGDLAASALKRQAGVKDTGALLPGHGGLLDRFDSLMFAAPVAYIGLLLARGWPMG